MWCLSLVIFGLTVNTLVTMISRFAHVRCVVERVLNEEEHKQSMSKFATERRCPLASGGQTSSVSPILFVEFSSLKLRADFRLVFLPSRQPE